MDFEKGEIILRMKDKQQSFTINTLLKQHVYLEECKKIDHEENDDYGSYH